MESIQWILTVSLLRDKLINRHSTNNKFDSLALKSFISDIFEKKYFYRSPSSYCSSLKQL